MLESIPKKSMIDVKFPELYMNHNSMPTWVTAGEDVILLSKETMNAFKHSKLMCNSLLNLQ